MIVLTTAPVTSGGHRTEPHGLTNRQVRELLDYEDVGTHQMPTGLCRAG
jgi:hypothetical protein